MNDPAKETDVLAHISQLVAEEHRLFDKGSLDEAETQRLTAIQVKLDQYWDLLRRRRALVETGKDAGEAKVRPAGVVEKYTG